MALPRRREFSAKTKLDAWHRAGGPDDPRCECGCGLPIDKRNPAEYHHRGERDNNSPENCLCVRRDCHKRLTGEETMPRVKRDRRQERMEANVKARKRPVPGSRADWRAKRWDKHEQRWVTVNRRTGERL